MPLPPTLDARPGDDAPPAAGPADPLRPAGSVARPARPGLADWLDLLARLRHDEGVPEAELRRRDRALGARIAPLSGRPERRLVAWVRTLRREDAASGLEAGGLQTAEAVRWIAAGLAAAGLAFGASAAVGAFAFQPRGRINVVAVLGLLVGLPGVLLAFALLQALPARWRRWLPWVGREPEGGGWLQPARWALRALPQRARDALESAFGRGRAMGRVAAPVQRWLLLSASQGAAVAFQAGALATAFGLVVFSDLSFGWSTTLSIDAATAHRVTNAIAAPWARLWPDAVPSAELLARTRFFRIAAERDPDVPPELYGGWWPFLVMSMAVYGLAPRVAFFAFARARLRRGLARAVLAAPGARRALDRMTSPLVETGANGPPAEGPATPDGGDGARDVPWPERAVVVSWAEALEGEAAAPVPGEAVSRLAAGGRRSPDDDRRAAASAAEAAGRAGVPVVVAVRGFEPPLLELLDFLGELRRALGDGREIVVGLVGGRPEHRRAWRRRLAAAGDPWLGCAALAGGEAAA